MSVSTGFDKLHPGIQKWIWQQPTWPKFTWDDCEITMALRDVRFRQGQLLGRMRGKHGDDVQDMLDNPIGNFGWILLGPEAGQTVKRFDSRHAPSAANRPTSPWPGAGSRSSSRNTRT